MSINEIKHLIFDGLNHKASVVGDGPALEALTKADQLGSNIDDSLWSSIPKYRLAHLLFRTAQTEKDLEKIYKLLIAVIDREPPPKLIFFSQILLLAVMTRLRAYPNLKQSITAGQLVDDAARILRRADFEDIYSNSPDQDLQSNFLNFLELAVYFAAEDYSPLRGIGLSDSYVPLVPFQSSIWRVVETNGTLEKIAYPKDLALIEINRRLKLGEADYYYICADREFKVYTHDKVELKISKYKQDGLAVKSLKKLHRAGALGLSQTDFQSIMNLSESLDSTVGLRQIRSVMKEAFATNVFEKRGGSNFLNPSIKLLGLVSQEYIN